MPFPNRVPAVQVNAKRKNSQFQTLRGEFIIYSQNLASNFINLFYPLFISVAVTTVDVQTLHFIWVLHVVLRLGAEKM